MSDDDVPFWAEPPFILLTDVLQLDKVDPWNVDVGKLVGSFLREMKRDGDIDFRISGNALYSASVIFMRKTRELVMYGLLPPEEEEDAKELTIPLIRPPFRLTNQRVTIEELLIAMDRVLSKGVRKRATPTKRRGKVKADPLQFRLDVTRANIEESIAHVYRDLCGMMEEGEVVSFLNILINNTRLEVVRVFFALLHLYTRAYLDIWMDEEGEIWIKLFNPPEKEELEEDIQSQIRTG